MKTRISLILVALLTLFLVGCASPQSEYSNRKVSVLGGAIKTEEGAHDRLGPLTIGLESSEINPGAKLKGGKVSFLWGLFTFVDE